MSKSIEGGRHEDGGEQKSSSIFDVENAKNLMERNYGYPYNTTKAYDEKIERARERGEKIIEIEVPIKITMPEGELVLSPGETLENALLDGQRRSYSEIIAKIKEATPEAVDASDEYHSIHKIVSDILKRGNSAEMTSEIKNVEQLLDKMEVIEKKFTKHARETNSIRRGFGLKGRQEKE